ncbi:MAG: NAD+ synthase [bacterium]
MTEKLHIALAQLNPTVGDIAGNQARIIQAYEQAAREQADLLICPELIICGYPPEDLVMKPSFLAACRQAVKELARLTATQSTGLIIGAPWLANPELRGKPFNAVFLLADGEIKEIRYKTRLPNYSVFDEPRRYKAGADTQVTLFRGVTLGLMICEDMWYPEVSAKLKEQGAEILIAPHGSPFRMTAHDERMSVAQERVRENQLPLIFVNQLGGQDELVFDGCGFVIDLHKVFHLPAFTEGIYPTQWQRQEGHWQCVSGPQEQWPTGDALAYQAVMLGTRDYVNKNHFKDVVIGLSGGIDSALTAAIAVDALGADRVRTVMMPSRYTADESRQDAEHCAELLGVRYETIAIEPAVDSFTDMLAPIFAGTQQDVTEENIQSRIRGVLLMAISNKFGPMVLTTGNKSEMSVGYATLYGDMNGGYNPLKDLYKTEVFDLSRWRNTTRPKDAKGPTGPVMPHTIITKPPSAELREDQKDADSLPPYEILDDILIGLIEKERSIAELVASGHDPALVTKIQHLLYIAEYKRRQAPPGPKITTRNFGRDRRYPITNGFRDRSN